MGVWLDSEKAFLISFPDEGECIDIIESEVEHRIRIPGDKKGFHRLGGRSNPEKTQMERQKHQFANYFNQVIKYLKDADKIYLFGPSTTKEWLEKEIKKDHSMSKKIIGIENSDLISERQMIARTKEFFREYQQNHKKKDRV